VSPGRLFVVSGPSGVGKGTVIRRLLSLRPDLVYVPSCTTRAPRPGEAPAHAYRFVSDGEFDRYIAEGAFLEWAWVFGHRSGTLARPVEEHVEAGDIVIKEMDVQGASQVRRRLPDAVLIFVAPPTGEALLERLRSRRTESEEEMARRLAEAPSELAQAGWFDHVVVNHDVDRAAGDLAAIIDGETRPGAP
jgi:guanylate kinase